MKTNPKNTPQSRADELWQRFVGLFGGESVKRKFGDDPPDEWVGVLAQLSDYQLERGMRRLLRSGKSTPPSLPEFSKLCRSIGNDELDEPQLAALAPPDTWQGDDWAAAANRHLLGYVLRQAGERVYYDARSTAVIVKWKNTWAKDMRESEPVPAVEHQKQHWQWCMERAEAECRTLREAA